VRAEELVEVVGAFTAEVLDVGFEQTTFVVWVEGWVIETWVVLEVLYRIVPQYLVVSTGTQL